MAEVPVLDLRGVRKAFNVGTPLEVEVLHGIDLQLRRREFCAVMGPSGSGKSTLLHLAGLLDRPTAGTLCICGQETRGLEEAALTRLRGQSLGFVFQYHHLLGAFTALENVMLPMLARFGRFQSWMAERAARLLDSVGLTPWAHHLASRLSGGQQQRVAVARALALEPVLLLADEPTGNLDTHSAELVFDLLRRVSREQGTAVLFVTHNPDLAARCDRKIEVVDGRVRERDWAFPGRRGASHP